jgi:lipid-A-disaccharide synthase-like uncharacterized protein
MINSENILGFIGTAVVVIGYLPQIMHLIKEKCAWGISLRSWALWLAGGVLLFVYSLQKQDAVFTSVQAIQILAIALTIFYARKSTQVCPYHSGRNHNQP